MDRARLERATHSLRAALPADFANTPVLGLVLGTGLSPLADSLTEQTRVPYADIESFPLSGEASHEGIFAYGKLNSQPVLAQMGRCHLYEGRTADEVCMGVRVMAMLGVKACVITNAAGAINPQFAAGSIMLTTDQINHTGVSPLTGPNDDSLGLRFPDMSRIFDADMVQLAHSAATAIGLRLEQGVYIGVHGPELESPAETRMYRAWGADAVGMSTVLEVIAARHMGMKVMALACLTNKNLPDCMGETSIEAIIAAANRTGSDLQKLLTAMAPKLRPLL